MSRAELDQRVRRRKSGNGQQSKQVKRPEIRSLTDEPIGEPLAYVADNSLDDWLTDGQVWLAISVMQPTYIRNPAELAAVANRWNYNRVTRSRLQKDHPRLGCSSWHPTVTKLKAKAQRGSCRGHRAVRELQTGAASRSALPNGSKPNTHLKVGRCYSLCDQARRDEAVGRRGPQLPSAPVAAYPLREKWVRDVVAYLARDSPMRTMQATTSPTHLSRGGYVQKTRDIDGHLICCRLQHHGPTSHEVGMRENLARTPTSKKQRLLLNCAGFVVLVLSWVSR